MGLFLPRRGELKLALEGPLVIALLKPRRKNTLGGKGGTDLLRFTLLQAHPYKIQIHNWQK
jgi:hypothetical protein